MLTSVELDSENTWVAVHRFHQPIKSLAVLSMSDQVNRNEPLNYMIRLFITKQIWFNYTVTSIKLVYENSKVWTLLKEKLLAPIKVYLSRGQIFIA